MRIDMNDWDKLYFLFLELEKITYLQGLVHYEQDQKALLDINYDSIRGYTQKELWKQQAAATEAIKNQLNEILSKKDSDC